MDLYVESLKKNNEETKTRYKCFRNKLNHFIKITKTIYYNNKLKNSLNQSKGSWAVINEIFGKKRKLSSIPQLRNKHGSQVRAHRERKYI